MKSEIMEKLSRSVHRVGFKLKKHSPEILVAVGVVGTVATVVTACKATLKVNDILDEAKETIDKIHESVEEEKTTADGVIYTQEDANKDLFIVYAQTGWKFVKLYGPSATLGILSIGCLLGSNQILRKRNAVLAAAFTDVTTNFEQYRSRLIERFGKDVDRELRYNIKAQEVEERVVDEDGNETVIKKTVKVVDPTLHHDVYSVVFCEGNLGWTKNPDLNKVFLLNQQRQANDRLRLEGKLSLNDVYEMIGAPKTSFGQLAGWIWTEDSSVGDNFVDFGIFNVEDEKKCEFINGYERSIILDFNCIGEAYKYF